LHKCYISVDLVIFLATEFNYAYVEAGNFKKPVVVRNLDGLGARFPKRETFTAATAARLLGEFSRLPNIYTLYTIL
jgi:hypothetical protein